MANAILAQTAQKIIDIQPIPYHQTCNMVVKTNVTTRQTYDAVTAEFAPDYTNAPLILFPDCQLINPDSPTSGIAANADLSNFKWEEITSSSTTTIATEAGLSVASGYELVTSGQYRGMLTVKTNGVVGINRKFRFYAEWLDKTSGYIYRFNRDIYLVIEDVTDARASITLDISNTDTWNPFRQQATRYINALVMVGTHNMTDNAKTKIFWYRISSDGTRALIQSADDEDGWEISAVTKGTSGQITGITVDRDKMGDGVSYEVRCAYRTDGNLPSEPESGDPIATTNLVRKIPNITASFTNSGARVTSGTSVLLKAIVCDNNGEIPDWDEVAYAAWYLCTSSVNSSTGTVTTTRTLLGTGKEITVEIDKVKNIQLDIIDRGATAALVDDSGNYVVSDSDEVLIAKPTIV
jgi:hypothetical protein